MSQRPNLPHALPAVLIRVPLLITLLAGLGLASASLADPVSTACPPCAWIASAINQAQAELDAARAELKEAKEAEEKAYSAVEEARERIDRLQGQMNSINFPDYEVIPDSKLPSGDLRRLDQLRGRHAQAKKDRDSAYDTYGDAQRRRQAAEKRIKELTGRIAALKNDLAVCERDMCPPVKAGGTAGVAGGGGSGAGGTSWTPEQPLDLERVSTDCLPHCASAAEAVNAKIAALEALSKALYEAKKALAKATADKEEALDREDRIAGQLNALEGQTDSAAQGRRATLEKRLEQARKDVTAAAAEKIKQREKIAKIEQDMEQTQQAIDAAKSALTACEQTYCKTAGDQRIGYLPGGGPVRPLPPGLAPGCFDAAQMQVKDLGQLPSDATKMLEGAASSALGSLLGGASGGLLGMAGGGDDQGSADLSDNPFGKQPQQTITTANGETIGLDAILTTMAQARRSAAEAKRASEPYEDDFGDMVYPAPKQPDQAGLKLGVRIPEKLAADRKFTFADAYLVDSACNQVQPTGRYVYEVWEETTFSWSITFWRWRNDALVEHWHRAGSEQWSELLASGQIPLHVGVEFAGISPADVAGKGYVLMTHWTYESEGHVYGYPLGFPLEPGFDPRALDPQDANVRPGIGFGSL